MPIPENIELLMPWKTIQGSGSIYFSSELQRELPPGHVLYGIKARAVAVRLDQDDVLYEIEGPMPLAVVHLTNAKETDSRWPRSKLFQSWQDWVRDEMLPAHRDYVLPDES